MNSIYQVTIRGRKFESRDLRKLLARAVAEKRSIDRRLRLFGALPDNALYAGGRGMTGDLCAGFATGR
jgi:hypothetical protein